MAWTMCPGFEIAITAKREGYRGKEEDESRNESCSSGL